jgi:hypothetical protein
MRHPVFGCMKIKQLMNFTPLARALLHGLHLVSKIESSKNETDA